MTGEERVRGKYTGFAAKTDFVTLDCIARRPRSVMSSNGQRAFRSGR